VAAMLWTTAGGELPVAVIAVFADGELLVTLIAEFIDGIASFSVTEIAGAGETVAGVEIPSAILPAVPDIVVGRRSKKVSNSESCAPLMESARVKAYRAATRPISNPKSDRHNAAMGVIT